MTVTTFLPSSAIAFCISQSFDTDKLQETIFLCLYSKLPCRPSGKVSVSRAADLGWILASQVDIFPGSVIPVT